MADEKPSLEGRIGRGVLGAFAGLLLSPWIGFGLFSFDTEVLGEARGRLGFALVAGISAVVGGVFGAVCGSVEIREPWRTRIHSSLVGAVLGCIGGSPMILGPWAGHLLLLTTPLGAVVGLIVGSAITAARPEPSKPTSPPTGDLWDRDLDA